jgi:hypothetical protein
VRDLEPKGTPFTDLLLRWKHVPQIDVVSLCADLDEILHQRFDPATPVGGCRSTPLIRIGAGQVLRLGPTGKNPLGRSAVDFTAGASKITIEPLNEYGLGALSRASK